MEEQSAELRSVLTELFGTDISLKHMTSLATLIKQEITHNKTMIEGLNQEHIPLIKHYGEWVVSQSHSVLGHLYRELIVAFSVAVAS